MPSPVSGHAANNLSALELDCIIRNLRAQYHEDWLLLPTLLSHAASLHGSRSFVEIGAYRGTSLSNTYVLERCFNWSGILIEANAKNFDVLQTAGRINSQLVHSAVCEGDGSTGSTVPMTVDGMAVAGQIGAMSPEYVRAMRVGDNMSDVVHVPCRSLQSILADHAELTRREARHLARHGGRQRRAAGGFGLLSLDVEGAEDLVLRTVDPAAFGVIVVEMDGYDPAKDERAHRLITASGLRPAAALQVERSRVYLRPDVAEEPWLPRDPIWRGHCGITEERSRSGRCDRTVDKGSWAMTPSSSLGLVDIPSCVAHCKRACGERCQYVSASYAYRDCSWYARCDGFYWAQRQGPHHEHFSVEVSRLPSPPSVQPLERFLGSRVML